MNGVVGSLEPPSSPPSRLYARFSRRLQALVVDALVYVISMIVLIVLLEWARGPRASLATIMLAWVGFLFLYEPLLVWRRGATIGHGYANIHVVDLRSGGNPGFFRALGRFVLKGLFGLLAFAFMGTTRRHQALHDLAFGTTVEIRDPARASERHYAGERVPDVTRVQAARWRRVLVILVYSGIWFVLFSLALLATESADCIGRNACDPAERLWETVLELAWMGGQAACIIWGWTGRLPGARSRAASRAAS